MSGQVQADRTALCHRCNDITSTVLLPLSSGHIGRVCAVCRTCRQGHPYATRNEYRQHLDAAQRQEEQAHENSIR
jgi:hypothetical protein